MATARGSFEIKLTPDPPYDSADGVTLGLMRAEKRFVGELDGTSTLTMTAARTPTSGSAGYVAIERLSCTLAGKRGSFVLQHSGTMNRGAATLSCTVVPDSATGELVGLSGSMRIDIDAGQHNYAFDYEWNG
jgi:hypothetical protein